MALCRINNYAFMLDGCKITLDGMDILDYTKKNNIPKLNEQHQCYGCGYPVKGLDRCPACGNKI